jgi:hypothetical protein
MMLYFNEKIILLRQEYASNLEKELHNNYHQKYSTSLYGNELEHILIISKKCNEIKNYTLIRAKEIGIVSCKCQWLDNRVFLKVE